MEQSVIERLQAKSPEDVGRLRFSSIWYIIMLSNKDIEKQVANVYELGSGHYWNH